MNTPQSYAIALAVNTQDFEAAAKLLTNYAASLPVDLSYQNFDAELAALPGQYASPGGALLLTYTKDGTALGCVGLRPIAPASCCEMKRLFLVKEAQGLGLGRAMAEAVINEARRLGYQELRLDTLPTMIAAIGLYERLGFRRISPYYAPTPPGTVFMALQL